MNKPIYNTLNREINNMCKRAKRHCTGVVNDININNFRRDSSDSDIEVNCENSNGHNIKRMFKQFEFQF